MVQPTRTRGVVQTVRRQVISNWRRALAFAIGLLLASASFYTTWQGLVTFTDPDPDSRSWSSELLGLSLAAGLQGLMLLAAWNFGEAWVLRTSPYTSGLRAARSDLGWLVMLLATMALSISFSYHTFYTGIAQYFSSAPVTVQRATSDAVSDVLSRGNRSAHINNLAQIHVRRVVGADLTEMRSAAESQRQAYFEALTQSDRNLSKDARELRRATPSLISAQVAWNTYRGNMGEIYDFGLKSIPLIQETTEKRLSDDKKRLENLATESEKSQRELEQASDTYEGTKKEVGKINTKIEESKTRINGLTTEIESYERRAQAARNKMQCERYGTECLGGGRRPPAGMKTQYYLAVDDLRNAESLRGQAESIRTEERGKLADLEKQLTQLNQKQTESQLQVAKGKATASTSPQSGDVKSLLSVGQLKNMLDGMSSALEHIKDPADFGEAKPVGTAASPDTKRGPPATGNEQPSALLQLEMNCEKIKAHLANDLFGEVAVKARKLSCAQDGFSSATQRIQQLNSGLRGFDIKQCQTLGPDYRRANTATLIARGEDCLETVALNGERYDHFMLSFAELSREHNESVHPFVQSWHGLTTYNDKLAFWSLGIAIMVDVLVFFVGIAGGRESLRRIDRIGEELRGHEVLALALAASKVERASDSEDVRVARLFINRLNPQDYVPNPHNAPHVIYGGYIAEQDLQRGVPEDDLVRRQIQMWMSTPKSGVDLVLRVPRPRQADQRRDSGLIEPEFEEEPVRFFFLRELVIDLAENIVHWDKAHASPGTDAVAAAPPPPAGQRRGQSDRNARPPAAPKSSFWSWGRSSRKHSEAMNGADAGAGRSDRDFRVRRPDGSIAEVQLPAEDGNRPATNGVNGANGKAAPAEPITLPTTAETPPPHHLRPAP